MPSSPTLIQRPNLLVLWTLVLKVVLTDKGPHFASDRQFFIAPEKHQEGMSGVRPYTSDGQKLALDRCGRNRRIAERLQIELPRDDLLG